MPYKQPIKKLKDKDEIYMEKEAKKILKKVDKEKYRGYKIGDLRKTFTEHQDKVNWKRPVYAIVDTPQEAEKLKTAIIFFQADVPTITKITVPVKHKEGLVYMEGTAYEVQSKGYQG